MNDKEKIEKQIKVSNNCETVANKLGKIGGIAAIVGLTLTLVGLGFEFFGSHVDKKIMKNIKKGREEGTISPSEKYFYRKDRVDKYIKKHVTVQVKVGAGAGAVTALYSAASSLFGNDANEKTEENQLKTVTSTPLVIEERTKIEKGEKVVRKPRPERRNNNSEEFKARPRRKL